MLKRTRANHGPPSPAAERGDETLALFREWRRTGDPRIREQLVDRHLNLVRYLARKFAGRGEPVDDLIQVGVIGLLNAIDRFDMDRGVRFTTYATPTIVGEVKRYFRDRGWAIKVPRRLQELNLAANKAIDRLTQRLERTPTMKEIAHEVHATEEETLEALELGYMYELVSLDSELSVADDDSALLSDYVGTHDPGLADFAEIANLKQGLARLPPRERSIIRLRFLAGLSQTEVARKLGISQMHVSRLQARALARLREYMAEESGTRPGAQDKRRA